MDSLISVASAPPLWLRVVCTLAHKFGLYLPAHQVNRYLSKSGFKRSEQ